MFVGTLQSSKENFGGNKILDFRLPKRRTAQDQILMNFISFETTTLFRIHQEILIKFQSLINLWNSW